MDWCGLGFNIFGVVIIGYIKFVEPDGSVGGDTGSEVSRGDGLMRVCDGGTSGGAKWTAVCTVGFGTGREVVLDMVGEVCNRDDGIWECSGWSSTLLPIVLLLPITLVVVTVVTVGVIPLWCFHSGKWVVVGVGIGPGCARKFFPSRLTKNLTSFLGEFSATIAIIFRVELRAYEKIFWLSVSSARTAVLLRCQNLNVLSTFTTIVLYLGKTSTDMEGLCL
jgi:hypothetical protein